MKTKHLYKWDSSQESPKPMMRERLAHLLKASKSRRGRGNTWKTAQGYWIRDAGMSIIKVK
jgi:hypothetical protein